MHEGRLKGEFHLVLSCADCDAMQPFQTRVPDTAMPTAHRLGWRYMEGHWRCMPCLKARAAKQAWSRCEACGGFGQVGEARNGKIIQMGCGACGGVGFRPPKKTPTGPFPWDVPISGAPFWLKRHHVEILAYCRNNPAAFICCEFTDQPRHFAPRWASHQSPGSTPGKIMESCETLVHALGLEGSRTYWTLPDAPKLNRVKVVNLIRAGLLQPKEPGQLKEWNLSNNGKVALLSYGFAADEDEDRSTTAKAK